MEKTELQVLICTYGRDGIQRVARAAHPCVPGVSYLVSWQTAGYSKIPESLDRDDFEIHRSDTHGLSLNRNISIQKSSAPLLLLSDDDVGYTSTQLQEVIRQFAAHPEADILTFRYDSATNGKRYPDFAFNLNRPPKGYYVSSIEIAFRSDKVKDAIRFNENFGIGAMFPSGEENIFIFDAMKKGLRGEFIPVSIATHDGETTSTRTLMAPSRPQTKGAMFLHLSPGIWPLKLISHSMQEAGKWIAGKVPSPFFFIKNWLIGVKMAKRNKVFDV